MNNLQRAKDNAHQLYCDFQDVPNTGLNAEHVPFIDEIVTSTYLQAVEENFTKIGMVHLKQFCKDLKSTHSKGKDVMYAVRRTEQYPFVFETNKDVKKQVDKFLQSLKQTRE